LFFKIARHPTVQGWIEPTGMFYNKIPTTTNITPDGKHSTQTGPSNRRPDILYVGLIPNESSAVDFVVSTIDHNEIVPNSQPGAAYIKAEKRKIKEAATLHPQFIIRPFSLDELGGTSDGAMVITNYFRQLLPSTWANIRTQLSCSLMRASMGVYIRTPPSTNQPNLIMK